MLLIKSSRVVVLSGFYKSKAKENSAELREIPKNVCGIPRQESTLVPELWKPILESLGTPW